MSENQKFKVGSIWKRCDGVQAIVLQIDDDGTMLVWSKDRLTPQWLCANGVYSRSGQNIADLIEPWTEPRVFTHTIYVHQMRGGNCYFGDNAKNSDNTIVGGEPAKGTPYEVIAIKEINVTITEGEGL